MMQINNLGMKQFGNLEMRFQFEYLEI